MRISGYRYLLLAVSPAAIFLLSACLEEDEKKAAVFHCSYEVSSTGCNNGTYSAYEARCMTVDPNNLRSDVNTDTYCSDVFPASDTECSATCCVSFRYRNVVQANGACDSQTAQLASFSAQATSDSSLKFELNWDSSADLDLAVMTPLRAEVSSRSAQVDPCQFGGDDRYALDGAKEAVSCGSGYLTGQYKVIVSNPGASAQGAILKITRNKDVLRQQQIQVAADEPTVVDVQIE